MQPFVRMVAHLSMCVRVHTREHVHTCVCTHMDVWHVHGRGCMCTCVCSAHMRVHNARTCTRVCSARTWVCMRMHPGRCACVHVCRCMYLCACKCMCACMWVCVRVYMWVHACVCMCLCAHMWVYVCVHVFVCAQACGCVCMHMAQTTADACPVYRRGQRQPSTLPTTALCLAQSLLMVTVTHLRGEESEWSLSCFFSGMGGRSGVLGCPAGWRGAWLPLLEAAL